MPVIGRLDGQVDEVLIAPLERRRRQGDDAAAQHASQDQLEKHAPRDETEHAAARQRFRKESTREELPVWLL